MRSRAFLVCAAIFCCLWPCQVRAYSVLSHEAVIDAVWETNLKPALLKRFPNTTPGEVTQAQAYAYGGLFRTWVTTRTAVISLRT